MSVNKKKNTLICFLIILTLLSLFSQEGEILPAEASKEFITLYMHGFSLNNKETADPFDFSVFSPDAVFWPEGAYSTVNYFRGDSTEPSPYQLTENGFTNFFYYHLTGGEGRGLPEFPDRPVLNDDGTVHSPGFFDYTVNSNKDYPIISDIFMEEIGDFNSGSRYLSEAQRQPFLGLAKCEWVYRNSQFLKSINLSPNNYKTLINSLLTTGPKFHELLSSADYLLGTRADGTPIIVNGQPLSNKLQVLVDTNKYTSTDLRTIAAEFTTLARQTPNTFRFVAHSMGGMYTMRYISEPESKYYTREVGGFYQRNRDYTFTEYLEDVYGISTWPATGLPAPKARYQSLLAYLKTEVVTAVNFPGWDARTAEEFIYNLYFRPERQNGVDKVIIQDSPLNGVYGADDLKDLAGTLFTREGIEVYKRDLVAAAAADRC